MTNFNFTKSKKMKNNEFYTKIETIEKELKYYKKHFKEKIVYLNCDKEWSNFYKYFKDNKDFLGVKEIIRTSNDFRLPENIENLKRADIVITNPPFSLWREYFDLLIENKKHFLILGSFSALVYKNVFPLIKKGDIWIGENFETEFLKNVKDENSILKSPALWYTNLDYSLKQKPKLILTKKYNKKDYFKYENYDAINVDKVKDIPKDYYGEMGVPISFLKKYNSSQFEIINLGQVGFCDFKNNNPMVQISTGKRVKNAKGNLYRIWKKGEKGEPGYKNIKTGELYKSYYKRIIIKRIKEN